MIERANFLKNEWPSRHEGRRQLFEIKFLYFRSRFVLLSCHAASSHWWGSNSIFDETKMENWTWGEPTPVNISGWGGWAGVCATNNGINWQTHQQFLTCLFASTVKHRSSWVPFLPLRNQTGCDLSSEDIIHVPYQIVPFSGIKAH